MKTQASSSSLPLSGNAIKLIALFSMTIDHIGMIFFPQYKIFRHIGRLAFPLFAYMIGEGFFYTRNKTKYFLSLFSVGVICQIAYASFMNPWHQNILITFSLSVFTLLTIDYFLRKKNKLSFILLIGCAVLLWLILGVFPHFIKGFGTDYGAVGVFLPVLVYLLPKKSLKIICTSLLLTLLALTTKQSQWLALLSVPLLCLYNGKRGKLGMKYLFYVYYPSHLAFLYLLELWLEK